MKFWMASVPAWGGMSPIPLVAHGALRDWLHGFKSRKQPRPDVELRGHSPPILIGYAPTGSRAVWVGLARFIASPGGRDFMNRYNTVATPARRGAGRDLDDLFKDIQRFLRDQRRGGPYIKGIAYPYPKGGGLTGTGQPKTAAMTQAMAQMLTQTTRDTERDRREEDTFMGWLERRYSRTSKARFLRRFK